MFIQIETYNQFRPQKENNKDTIAREPLNQDDIERGGVDFL